MADLASVAEEADQVLAKLIASKSPILMNWLAERSLQNAKEEHIAKAWRRYYLQKFVSDRFPTDNPKVNRSVEAVFDDLATLLFPEDYRKTTSQILLELQKDAKAMVRGWALPEKDKQSILHRIDTLRLQWLVDLSDSPYQRSPQSFLKTQLDYDSSKHVIHVGALTRQLPDSTTLYVRLAQAVGHAFDSCQWGMHLPSSWPFKPLVACLRDPSGVGAKTRDDRGMKQAIQKRRLRKETAQSLQQNPTCNHPDYPNESLQRDQLNSAFADWFATEVYVSSQRSSGFPRPDLCASQKIEPFASQLPPEVRLHKIYLAHPKIPKPWKSPSAGTYCSLPVKNAE
jgi:hypothetical protein